MIDIDLLDQQLEAALTVELRSQLKPLAKPSQPRLTRLGASRGPAPSPDPEPWLAESDVWLVDDEVWGADHDPWPSDPDIWAGGAEAWPAEPQPEPTTAPPPPAAVSPSERTAEAPTSPSVERTTQPAARAKPIRKEAARAIPTRRPPARPGAEARPTTSRAPNSRRTTQRSSRPAAPPAGTIDARPSASPSRPTPPTDRRRSAAPANREGPATATARAPRPAAAPAAGPSGAPSTPARQPEARRSDRRRATRPEGASPAPPSGWVPPSLMALPFEKATPAPEPSASSGKPGRAPRAPKTSPAPVAPDAAAPAASDQPVDAHQTRDLHLRPPRQLERAPALDIESHAQRIVELVAAGRIGEADLHIAAHAELAREEGTMADRRDAAAWATMRALLDGRQADARSGNELVRQLGAQANDPNGDERYWRQRFWVVLEWGSEEERFDLLDHCRRRAYWQQDIGWRSALVLLLARMGRTDEAAREFDETAPRILRGRAHDAEWVDMTTNLAEAAAVLNDPRRATMVNRAVDWPKAGMVVAGRAQVCKGSIARYHALLATTTIRWAEADSGFSTAAEAHRRAAAQPLLARTLREWGRSLTGRDDLRSRDCLAESTALATRLELVELLAAQ